jgi:hypothetical protein
MEHDQPDFQPGQLLKVGSVEPPEHLTMSTASGVGIVNLTDRR